MKKLLLIFVIAIVITGITSKDSTSEAFYSTQQHNSNQMNEATVTKTEDRLEAELIGSSNSPTKVEVPEYYSSDLTDILLLVNKHNSLPSDYVPPDLVEPDVVFTVSYQDPKRLMRKEAAEALTLMFKQAAVDGIDLLAVSGYRSYEVQAAIFASNSGLKGEFEANKTSARAGQSEHQTGLAMDITCRAVNNGLYCDFGQTREGIWVAKNCADFGFIIRYPSGKEDITGYTYEPWHLRYVGVDAARTIYQQGITLEEYLDRK